MVVMATSSRNNRPKMYQNTNLCSSDNDVYHLRLTQYRLKTLAQQGAISWDDVCDITWTYDVIWASAAILFI